MTQLIREWVLSCERCLRESRINPRLTRLPLQNPNEYIIAPEEAMLTSNQDAETIAKLIINIMTQHAYLPTTFISDEGTALMAHVIKEVASVLDITLKHATTKPAQTIGLLERSQSNKH